MRPTVDLGVFARPLVFWTTLFLVVLLGQDLGAVWHWRVGKTPAGHLVPTGSPDGGARCYLGLVDASVKEREYGQSVGGPPEMAG
jgi:hypothetical protein